MKFFFSLIYFICFVFPLANAQNVFTVTVNNIKEGDSVRVIAQKSSESFFKKWIYGSTTPTEAVFSLSDGEWAIKLDATGYTYPSQQIVSIPDDVSITFGLTELVGGNFSYTWEDDGSAAGHATQRYVNEPPNIVILNDTLSVPDDYSAIKLRTEYGVILSNDKETWSSEDSYRLYQMFESLPYNAYGEHDDNDYAEGEGVRGVFYLTDLEQDDDLSIELVDGVKHATFSQSAFVYSEPMIGKLDGIKGKFFSKRLYHTIVKFVTDFAKDDNALAWIAREKFGIEFLSSTQQTEELMGEDSSNFQAFFNTEKLEILSMLEELPDGFHKQDGLKFMVRRINGQDNPQYPTAAAIAWTGLNVIEFMSKAFISSDIHDTRRLILHEKAHFLWAYTFDDNLKNDWIEIGGWYEDPTSASGWSTTNTTEAVSAYAHLKNPNEDMAESIAFYLTNPDALMSVSMQKFEFIRDRVMHGTRYIAQIREDLTFTVYNLYPDYTYPGKVTKVEVDVAGDSEEDKLVTIRATLNSSDPELDGASGAYIRFTSGSGTFHDIGLSPENGQQSDSVLVGTTTFNKFEKSGYWNLSFFKVTDPVGNMRYENRSTVGMKLYIENPLEDITPPKYNDDYTMELVTENFSEGSFGSNLDENGIEMRAIKLKFSHYDKVPIRRSYARMNVPNNNHSEVYNRDIQQNGAVVDPERGYDNGFDSDKHFELYLPIHEYYQSGWYSTTYSFATDIAGNKGTVYHVADTTDFHISENDKHKIFKHTRDSIFVETLYPDYKKPEIDINNISITAEPTNPTAPDGETRVEIDILARDFSDFEGHESGVYKVSFTLRDPLGGIHGYQTGNSTMNNPDLNHHDANPQNDNEWRLYNFDLLLPKGSPPGQWGMASATVVDRAGNREQYSFVEYVRFDIIPSDIELTSPLEAEITDKVVNLDNLSSISATMSCSPCEGLNYGYTIYSLMGGNVVRGEGVFTADSIEVDNIDTSGVLDGVIKLTVQVTDSEDKLVATKSVEYTKDTVRPKSYYSRSNLENEGTSSLDDFLIDVVVESADVGGSYIVTVQNVNSGVARINSNRYITSTNVNNMLSFSGQIISSEFNISGLDLSSLSDGFVEIKLQVTDPNGNTGQEPNLEYYRIKGNIIQYVGNIPVFDSDEDGLKDDLDQCPDTPSNETVDENGCSNSQKDTDNDGVTDDIDQCSVTPAAALVDVNGCEVFTLPVQNFKVEVGSATCVGNSDGVINLSIEDASYDYSVTITGRDNVTIAGDSKTSSITGLPKGTYTVCFKVDGEDNFEQCFEVEVNEPQALSAFMEVNGQNLNITMSGSSQYSIDVNGNTQITSSNNFETELSSGLNIIKVYTSLKCQGFVEEQILISEEVYYYPNPTQNDVNILVGGKDENVSVSVLTIDGSLIYSREQHVSGITRKTVVDLSKQTSGTYIVVIESETVSQTFKIIKE